MRPYLRWERAATILSNAITGDGTTLQSGFTDDLLGQNENQHLRDSQGSPVSLRAAGHSDEAPLDVRVKGLVGKIAMGTTALESRDFHFIDKALRRFGYTQGIDDPNIPNFSTGAADQSLTLKYPDVSIESVPYALTEGVLDPGTSEEDA